jgi:hypothetical protein
MILYTMVEKKKRIHKRKVVKTHAKKGGATASASSTVIVNLGSKRSAQRKNAPPASTPYIPKIAYQPQFYGQPLYPTPQQPYPQKIAEPIQNIPKVSFATQTESPEFVSFQTQTDAPEIVPVRTVRTQTKPTSVSEFQTQTEAPEIVPVRTVKTQTKPTSVSEFQTQTEAPEIVSVRTVRTQTKPTSVSEFQTQTEAPEIVPVRTVKTQTKPTSVSEFQTQTEVPEKSSVSFETQTEPIFSGDEYGDETSSTAMLSYMKLPQYQREQTTKITQFFRPEEETVSMRDIQQRYELAKSYPHFTPEEDEPIIESGARAEPALESQSARVEIPSETPDTRRAGEESTPALGEILSPTKKPQGGRPPTYLPVWSAQLEDKLAEILQDNNPDKARQMLVKQANTVRSEYRKKNYQDPSPEEINARLVAYVYKKEKAKEKEAKAKAQK